MEELCAGDGTAVVLPDCGNIALRSVQKIARDSGLPVEIVQHSRFNGAGRSRPQIWAVRTDL